MEKNSNLKAKPSSFSLLMLVHPFSVNSLLRSEEQGMNMYILFCAHYVCRAKGTLFNFTLLKVQGIFVNV